jgi:hypothetical protein
MLVTGRPSPTGLAGRQLFENCQVCQSAPSDRPEAKTLEILAWRSMEIVCLFVYVFLTLTIYVLNQFKHCGTFV